MPPIVEAGWRDDKNIADTGALQAHGPTLQVMVGGFPGTSVTMSCAVPALIDTGAQESCIDQTFAQSLGLPVIDTIPMAGVGGINQHPVFLAQLMIPELNWGQYGRFAGVALADGGQHHKVLLGRTALSSMIMIYDGLRAQITVITPQNIPLAPTLPLGVIPPPAS